jgi:hypothetical protein
VPSTKWEVERETGLEPATFSLEGLDLLAVSRASWQGVHFVPSYRVVVSRFRRHPRRRSNPRMVSGPVRVSPVIQWPSWQK